MITKWKCILYGIIISLIISIITLYIIYIFSEPRLYLLIYLGALLGGIIAIYLAKSITIKETVIVGSYVGLFSSILYIIISITILYSMSLFSPETGQPNQGSPQAFMMEGIIDELFEPSLTSYIHGVLISLKIIIIFTFVSIFGNMSYYYINQMNDKRK